MSEPTYPEITVQLTGVDGNVYVLMGTVSLAMRRAGVPSAEITEFRDRVMKCASYGEALVVMMETVNVI
jgi:hypothetical protein